MQDLKDKTTEELEAMLAHEMDEHTETNVELVEALAVELNRRNPDPVDVDAAWKSFVENHLPYPPMFPDVE